MNATDLIPLVRWLRNSQQRHDRDGSLHAIEAGKAVDAWLREYDAQEEVRHPVYVHSKSLAKRIQVLADAEYQRGLTENIGPQRATPKSVRAVEAESRQARKELGDA